MKVTVEVRNKAITRRVSVTTGSIERALKLAGGNIPGAKARVVFPTDPDSFFTGGFDGPAATTPPVPEMAPVGLLPAHHEEIGAEAAA